MYFVFWQFCGCFSNRVGVLVKCVGFSGNCVGVLVKCVGVLVICGCFGNVCVF